jgi:hypothetical protein
MPSNIPAIQSAWTTAKSHLTSFQNDLATLITDLANLEADRDALENLGAGDVADWLRIRVEEALKSALAKDLRFRGEPLARSASDWGRARLRYGNRSRNLV